MSDLLQTIAELESTANALRKVISILDTTVSENAVRLQRLAYSCMEDEKPEGPEHLTKAQVHQIIANTALSTTQYGEVRYADGQFNLIAELGRALGLPEPLIQEADHWRYD